MRSFSNWVRLTLAGLALACGAAQATVIFSADVTLTANTPTQTDRLQRVGVPQTWVGDEVFPGLLSEVFNDPPLQFRYQAITLSMADVQSGFQDYAKYFQIVLDQDTSGTFLSAYLDVYNPTNLLENWLGDIGAGENLNPGAPGFFQVIVEQGHDLVLVFNETAFNGPLPLTRNILVEAFVDTDFTDPTAKEVPEPATWALVGVALVLSMTRTRRRQRASTTVEV